VLWHVFGEQIAEVASTGADEAAAQVVDFALRALGAPPADAGLPARGTAEKPTARV
jgi:hypothetical protein